MRVRYSPRYLHESVNATFKCTLTDIISLGTLNEIGLEVIGIIAKPMEPYLHKIVVTEKQCNDLSSLLDNLKNVNQLNRYETEEITVDLPDAEFLDEVRMVCENHGTPIYFGKTLQDLKCVITDDSMRDHVIHLQYRGPRKIVVTNVPLPYTDAYDQEYRSIDEILTTLEKHIEDLQGFFHELECIDKYCLVVEPKNPTYKDDYRKIVLDDRTWLHIEVTPKGLATNVHLVGQSEELQEKLQAGLLKWDHDLDIVENITAIFDVNCTNEKTRLITQETQEESPRCCICLCTELPDVSGLPLPLCQNPLCGVYFHRDCLFQWLVACSGGRPPAFGVANGNCPSCFQSVACSEKDA